VTHAREEFAFCLAGPFDFFNAFAFGNVFDSSFVVGNFALIVSNQARILTKPELAPVLPKYFVLEQFYGSLRFDQLLELFPAFWIDINYLFNVADAGN
jgi:hypothetical protein